MRRGQREEPSTRKGSNTSHRIRTRVRSCSLSHCKPRFQMKGFPSLPGLVEAGTRERTYLGLPHASEGSRSL